MRALVIGSSGGIGQALVSELTARDWDVTGLSRSKDGLDITDEASVEAAFVKLDGTFDLVFVATGALVSQNDRPEKSLREITGGELIAQYQVNAVGPINVLKQARRFLPRKQRSVFAALSARVGSIDDNQLGGWHSYRASKAALNQLLKGASIELARTHSEAVVVALHPGTVATSFTEDYAQSYDRVQPEMAAQNLLNVLEKLGSDATGSFLDYAGDTIPW